MKPLRLVVSLLGAVVALVGTHVEAQEPGCCQPVVLRAPIVLDTSPASARIRPWPATTARVDARRATTSQAPLTALPNTSPLVLPPPPSIPVTSSAAIGCGQTSPGMKVNPVTSYRPITTSPAAPYQIGKGIFGQPKLYVPSQPVRNFLRYLSL